MNIIIPPKVVTFLRNGVALSIAIYISYGIGIYTDTYYMTGLYLPFFQLLYLPWLVMVATKREIFLGFLTATITWGHFTVLQYLIDKQDRRSFGWDDLADNAIMWLITFVLSLIVTVPIYQWRKWRRRRPIQPNPEQPYYAKEQETD